MIAFDQISRCCKAIPSMPFRNFETGVTTTNEIDVPNRGTAAVMACTRSAVLDKLEIALLHRFKIEQCRRGPRAEGICSSIRAADVSRVSSHVLHQRFTLTRYCSCTERQAEAPHIYNTSESSFGADLAALHLAIPQIVRSQTLKFNTLIVGLRIQIVLHKLRSNHAAFTVVSTFVSAACCDAADRQTARHASLCIIALCADQVVELQQEYSQWHPLRVVPDHLVRRCR